MRPAHVSVSVDFYLFCCFSDCKILGSVLLRSAKRERADVRRALEEVCVLFI